MRKNRKTKISRDPVILSDEIIGYRDIDHTPENLTSVGYARHWHRHYLRVIHQKDEKASKRTYFDVIIRKYYLTIDGTSKTFIKTRDALDWLLSPPNNTETKTTIKNQNEFDLLLTFA